MKEQAAASNINREPLIDGLTPEQVRNLADLAVRYGLPQTLRWALIEHSVKVQYPEGHRYTIMSKDTNAEVLVMSALQRVKRGSKR